jgi:phosphate transport system substrate-binding protein
MTMQRYLCAACLLAALTVTACGRGSQPATEEGGSAPAGEIIKVDGSSTVFPISEAVAEEYQKANPGSPAATVGISGTGGGFQKFCRGETDISDASRPIRAAEIDACMKAGVQYIELPIAYDGLAVVVNPKNTWATSITVEDLKKMWAPEAQGKVMRWNQVRPNWPNREIRLFGAGVDSGTYDYFTEAVVGKEGASRGDFTSSEDDNVLVQGIAGDEAALGFLPYAYVAANKDKLKLVPVEGILPSPQTVRDGTYQPLSRPLFIYVARKSADRPEVQKFVETYFNSPELMQEVGYVELTPQLYDLVKKHFTERKLGTAFGAGGSQVGVTLEQLLAREK